MMLLQVVSNYSVQRGLLLNTNKTKLMLIVYAPHSLPAGLKIAEVENFSVPGLHHQYSG